MPSRLKEWNFSEGFTMENVRQLLTEEPCEHGIQYLQEACMKFRLPVTGKVPRSLGFDHWIARTPDVFMWLKKTGLIYRPKSPLEEHFTPKMSGSGGTDEQRKGDLWNPKEEEFLRQSFHHFMALQAILHQRSYVGIRERIRKHMSGGSYD